MRVVISNSVNQLKRKWEDSHNSNHIRLRNILNQEIEKIESDKDILKKFNNSSNKTYFRTILNKLGEGGFRQISIGQRTRAFFKVYKSFDSEDIAFISWINDEDNLLHDTRKKSKDDPVLTHFVDMVTNDQHEKFSDSYLGIIKYSNGKKFGDSCFQVKFEYRDNSTANCTLMLEKTIDKFGKEIYKTFAVSINGDDYSQDQLLIQRLILDLSNNGYGFEIKIAITSNVEQSDELRRIRVLARNLSLEETRDQNYIVFKV